MPSTHSFLRNADKPCATASNSELAVTSAVCQETEPVGLGRAEAAVENAISQAAFIMEHFEKRWAEKIICARRGRFPRLTLEDLTQIVRDGCAPSPSSPSRTSITLS